MTALGRSGSAIRAALTIVMCAWSQVASAQLACDPCTVGVVLDGPWERNDEIRGIFEREVLDLTSGEFVVQFPAAKRLLADWTLEGARQAVEALIADPEVDILLTSGPVASTYVGRRGNLPKPVIAAFVLDPELLGIPVATNDEGDRVSGVTNLTYVTFPSDLSETLTRFREVAPFDHLTILVNEGLATAIPELLDNTRAEVQELGIALEVIRVSNSVEAALAAISPESDAVYVVPLMQLPPGDFDRLVRGLIERRLPSFSYWGRSEVERGLLTSIYLDTDFERIGRRIAVSLRRVVRGDDAGTIPVDFRRSQRLTLNMATARAIGAYPSWSVMTEAEILHDDREDIQRQLDLMSVARMALDVNLDLLAQGRFVAAGAQDVQVARSVRFPQLNVSGLTQFIDKDRAEASFGSQPQRAFVGRAGVSQLIYSDAALAGVEIEQQVQEARVQQHAQTRLDVIRDATVAYLNVLRAKTFERIQRENLNVTRSNLELAQARRRIGVARASEVIRWENQIANNRREVIRASAQRNIAEIQLNRLLNRPLEEPFLTMESDLGDPALLTTAAQLSPYLDNPFAFDIFRDFMTREALAAAPEIAQLDAGIQAQTRALVTADRAFWAPTVALQGDVSGVQTAGAGSSGPGLDLPVGFAFTRPNKINWTLGLNASLPLFTGGARRAERTRAEEALAKLQLDRRAVAERIEQRVRSALHAAGASFAGIELANTAADAARSNLTLVTDAYEQGVLSILDLLDAQNAALVAEQLAANAVYDYLIDLMNVQRALGRFDFFREPAEQQAFLDRLARFFSAAGYQPGPIR